MRRSIYEFSDFRKYLQARLKSEAKRSGELLNLAKFLKAHPSRLSKILKGPDQPTSEQAFLIAQFLSLEEPESRYFSLLVESERAGSALYLRHLKKQIQEIRSAKLEPAPLSEPERKFTAADERIFYSSHKYSAVWLASMVSGKNELHQIAENLQVNIGTVKQIANFLVRVGLCDWEESGKLTPGARLLNLDLNSPNLGSFRMNWRNHALSKISSPDSIAENEIFYSEPMAIGADAYERVVAILKATVAEIREALKEQTADKVACLNIDWFKV
jgi:uncharacterized protein (TIGR02147 family)